MRAAAEASLATIPAFTASPGTPAIRPTRATVDVVTAAQVHWFDGEAARREFLRILRPGGAVVLVYNSWRDSDDPLAEAYDALINLFDPEREMGEAAPRAGDEDIAAFYGTGGFGRRDIPNPHWYNWDAFQGRALSSSYAPLPGHPNHEPFLAGLRSFFDAHTERAVRFPYHRLLGPG